ncbi:MAG TPA: hypothetical protein VIL89_03905 [Clostridia bacterium]
MDKGCKINIEQTVTKPEVPPNGNGSIQICCPCIARSVSSIELEPEGGTIAVPIPANACITQIFSSAEAVQAQLICIEVEVRNIGPSLYLHRIPANPEGTFAVFEVTFSHPLCVGDIDSAVRANFIRFGDTFRGSLSVLYCENCCQQTEVNG